MKWKIIFTLTSYTFHISIPISNLTSWWDNRMRQSSVRSNNQNYVWSWKSPQHGHMSYSNTNQDKTSISKQEASSFKESKDFNGPNIALPKANRSFVKLYILSNWYWGHRCTRLIADHKLNSQEIVCEGLIHVHMPFIWPRTWISKL